MLARRRQAASRQVHHGHRVLDRHQLLVAVAEVAVGAAQRRQDQCRCAVHDVTAVQLGRDLHRQSATAQRRLGDSGVRGGRDEVAAHADEHSGTTVAHRPDRVDDVVPMAAWTGDAEPRVQRGQELLGHLLPDAHRPVALHVRVPADRAHARAGLADHAAHQQQVGGFADGGHRVPVLGESHRPAEHRPLRGDQHLGDPLELLAIDTARLDHGVQIDCAGLLLVVVESGAVLGDEVAIEHRTRVLVVGLEEEAAQTGEERHVAAEADLDELVGDRDAVPHHAVHLLRILEPHQAGLWQRVDRDDLRAGRLGLLEHRQHPRMVGAGVLSGDQDAVGVLDVEHRHRALADADGVRPTPSPTIRGTCWSSPAGCWCRSCAPAADRGRRPRCWCGPRCRTPPRRDWTAPAARRRSAGRRRPTRSAGSAYRRGAAPWDG